MADGVEAASPVQRRRHLGSDLTREVLADADAAGEMDWAISVDSTINRAHQHAHEPARGDTGGLIELQESARTSRLIMRSADPAAG